MKCITTSICVQVSVHTAYLAWLKLDQFRAIVTRLCREPAALLPRRATGDSGRRRRERRGSRLTEQIPDQYLAWRNHAGVSMSTAEFEPLSDHRSRVTVFVSFEPSELHAPDIADQEIRLALQEFKTQTEQWALR